MALSELYAYVRFYDKDSFAVFSQQGAEPSEADIAAFESQIGFGLPDKFREYALHPLGGLYMAVKEELWPRPELYAVGPFWSFLFGVFVHSLSRESPDWLQMETGWKQMCEAGHSDLVPFLTVIDDADPYCFTPDGRIIVWHHETPDEPDSISETFSECMMREIRELEDRKRRKLNGEDKL